MGCRRGSAGGIVAHVPFPKEQKEYVLRANFFCVSAWDAAEQQASQTSPNFSEGFSGASGRPIYYKEAQEGRFVPNGSPVHCQCARLVPRGYEPQFARVRLGTGCKWRCVQ